MDEEEEEVKKGDWIGFGLRLERENLFIHVKALTGSFITFAVLCSV